MTSAGRSAGRMASLFGDDVGATDDVLQFAYVARPVIFFQRLDGGGGNGFGLPVLFLRDLLEKIIYQERNVLAAIAQRRDVDADDVEAVEQIFVELPRGDGLLQWFIGGRDDADIDLERLVAADAFKSAAFAGRAESLSAWAGSCRRFRRGRWCRCCIARTCRCAAWSHR